MDYERYPHMQCSSLIQAVEFGDLNLVKKYGSLGVNVGEIKTSSGLNMLMLASAIGHFHIVVYLLEKKMNLEIQDPKGHTALHFAACNGHIAIVDVLLHYGANKEATCHLGINALTFSLEYRQIETAFRLLSTMKAAELMYYKNQKYANLVFKCEMEMMKCQDKLSRIMRPLIFSQDHFKLTPENMHRLYLQFPFWYLHRIKQDLTSVCSMLQNMKTLQPTSTPHPPGVFFQTLVSKDEHSNSAPRQIWGKRPNMGW